RPNFLKLLGKAFSWFKVIVEEGEVVYPVAPSRDRQDPSNLRLICMRTVLTKNRWYLVKLHDIPEELHPRVVPEGMTINALPPGAIGLASITHRTLPSCERLSSLYADHLLVFYTLQVVVGSLLSPGATRVTHLAPPAVRLEDIPPKTGDMIMAEIPYRKVVDDKEKKKRKAEEKAATKAPAVNIQAEAAVDKPAGREGPRNADASYVLEGYGDNEGGLSGLQIRHSPVHPSGQRCDILEEPAPENVVPDAEAKALKQAEADAEQLRAEKVHFVVEAGKGEIVRQKIVNQYLPTFVRRLHQSAKYKRSLGQVFTLAVGKGFTDGISIGRKEEDIQAILKATPNVDPTSSETFLTAYEKFFDQRYPYVNKVARMYLLDPTELQNIMPDETGPTPGRGPRDTPTTSYA
nr:hypothetical protein [Tanacetum cinerariifolium]